MKIYGDDRPNGHRLGNKSVFDPRCGCGRCKNAPGKGGDIRSNHKNSAAKRAGRRHAKRRARAEGRRATLATRDTTYPPNP